ncbi:hypothetical protein CDL15_Pgr028775 [Punica granatum]|uniref:Uncharacterized protein n=1 Tax=Punica granatum TaxID=22663 RepID=A0A218VWU7_PUNGR|nr:hypothetical protein CDL15_Pgr028775 [Punica granatum]
MNLARTLGPAMATGHYTSLGIYMVAPMLGALTGAVVYTILKDADDEPNRPCTLRCFGHSIATCVWKGFTMAISECKTIHDDASG